MRVRTVPGLRRGVLLVLVLVASVSLWAAVAHTGRASRAPVALSRPEGRPLRVLFAGDSLTVGAFARGDARSFRGLVTRRLRAGGPVAASRIGDSGLTVQEVLPDARRLQGGGYDLVVVELGTNDWFHPRPHRFATDYARLLAVLRRSSPDAALVCLGVWRPGTLPATKRLDRVIVRECGQRRGRFVRLSPLYDDPANRGPRGRVWRDYLTDDFHPNDRGHAAIADALLPALR